jgi:hypothetical protein
MILAGSILLAAQESSDNPEVSDNFVYKVNQKGDQLIKINIIADFPVIPANLTIGGSGSLGYAYYFSDAFSVGGDAAFSYSKTVGNNIFLFVPLTVKAAYQFTAGKFEFPLGLSIGIAAQNYLDRAYWGLIVRPEVGAYYRYSQDWSFGIQTGLSILPQWYENTEYNRVGYIISAELSARYHF